VRTSWLPTRDHLPVPASGSLVAVPGGPRTRCAVLARLGRRGPRGLRILAAACAGALLLLPAAVASAATQTFTDSVSLQTTNWSDSVTVPKFDPRLGQLQQVRLAFLGHVEGDVRFESLDAAPATVTSELRSEISLRRPDRSPIVVSLPASSHSTSLSAFDGALDFAGTSGRDFPDEVAEDDQSAALSSPADRALFTASSAEENITLPVDAVGRSTATGAGNLTAQFQTSASASLTVTYVYNAVPVAQDDSATTLVDRPVGLDVLVNDRDPDGSLDPASVTVTTGPASGSPSVTPSTGAITYTPDAGFTGTDTFSYRVCDNDGLCTTADATVTVEPGADLAMSTTHTGTFVAGENGAYTLTVTNNGPSPAVGLTITDTLPDGLEFVSATGTGWTCSASGQTVTCTNPASLAGGASSTITLTAAVGDTAPSVTNTALVSATTADPAPGNNSSSDPAAVGLRSDLAITSSHADAFTVGDTGRYALLVTNDGPSAAYELTVTNTLPDGLAFVSGTGAGWTCSASGQTVACTHAGPLAPGAGSMIDLAVAVGSSAAPSVTNTASVSSASSDPVPENDATSDPTEVVRRFADLRITVRPTGEFTVGDTGRYELQVTNNGPGAASNLTVTDALPDGLEFVSATGTGWTCSASGQTVTCTNPGSLAAGESSTIVLRAKVTAAADTSIINAASVSGAVVDPRAANNDSSSSITVLSGTVSDRPRATAPDNLAATGADVVHLAATGLALALAGLLALALTARPWRRGSHVTGASTR